MADVAKSVKATAKRLMEDQKSRAPTVPWEVARSYQEDKVQEKISQRLSSGQRVHSAKALLPDIVTKRRRVLIAFEDEALGGEPVDSILVEINEDGKAENIIDPFVVDTDRRSLVEEQGGTFLTSYSEPVSRSGPGVSLLSERFEGFVRESGINTAFRRMADSFGGGRFSSFESGTCVITTKRIPTIGPPGGGDPFPGTEGLDAEDQEDDFANF